MRHFPLSAAIVIACTAPGIAAPLTCASFRDRLDGALLATGQKVDALVFKPGFTSPERGTRYDYASGSLSGTLSCGLADEFREFGIQLQLRSGDDLAADLRQLMTTQGASLCALTAGTAPACAEYGRSMIEKALSQMGSAYNHGVQHPSGLSEQTLFGTLHVTLTSAPTLVTFVVGPDIGQTVDADRQPLPAPAPPQSAATAPTEDLPPTPQSPPQPTPQPQAQPPG